MGNPDGAFPQIFADRAMFFAQVRIPVKKNVGFICRQRRQIPQTGVCKTASLTLPAGILHELGDCNPRKTVVKYHQSNKRRLSRFNWNGEIPTVPSRRRRTHMSPDIIGAIREDAGRRTSGVGIQTLTNPAELLGTVRRGALRTRKVPAGGFFLCPERSGSYAAQPGLPFNH